MSSLRPQEAASRFSQQIASAARRVWNDERLFFLALTVGNLFLARRTFGSGIWADNDSVCHYAYVRHLLEEFFPATGTFIGFTPKFDLGAPFLLYNTPPGVYVAAAALAKLTGLSALGALKTVMVLAFLSVPILGASLARTFEDDPRDLPKFTALALSLFSSELFGLEFYFKNGMLNPALAVPFMLATLVFFRRAQRETSHRALAWLGAAALTFGATAFVHLLTTYMMAIALGCFVIGAGPKRFGRSVIQVGVVAGLGATLVAFWLVPSMHFAAKDDAAFTWIRRAEDTVSNYLDGSLLSSYPVGFYPQFVTYSGVGIVAILCAAFGVWRGIRRWNWAVLSCIACAAIAFLVTLGPRPSFGLWILPMYHRLLWYRFATLLELATLLVAGWGAWQLYETRERFGVVVVHGLVGAACWAGLVMTQRAVKVETAKDYPQFVKDVDVVAAWLREHGKKGGRVYSEFLGQNVVDSVGVNYPRHMIPVLSGYPEAGGWVYENDEAAQAMMRRGLFWYDPFPMIALAERYDVQYIVAGSPNFVRVLGHDPRWHLALATQHVSIFEAVGREPSLVDGPGWDARVTSERYLRGGGYEYVVEARPSGAGEPSHDLVVKTGWSPAWHARAAGRELTLSSTEDALLRVELPQAVASTVTLTWDIGPWRRTGDWLSLAGLAVAAVMIVVGTRRKLGLPSIPERGLQVAGACGAAAAVVVFVLRAHPIDEHVVGFGVRDGMDVTYDMRRLDVGAFDDAQPFRPTRVIEGSWGERTLLGAAPARVLTERDASAAIVTLAPRGPNAITVRGVLHDGVTGATRADATLTLVVREPARHAEVCRIEAALGRAATVPDACLAGATGDGPGVQRELALEADGVLTVDGIVVDSGMVVVEGEQMHNVLDDSGYEAFYAYGPPDQLSSNGVSMVAFAGYEKPIALDRAISLPAPEYEAWILTHTVSARLENGRAHFLLESDGRTVADIEPRTRSIIPYWDDDPHLEWLPAGRLDGGGVHRVRFTFYKVKDAFNGLGDLDALAFVPVQ